MSSYPARAFQRYDETPDEEFYQQPRLVTHIDDNAIAAVTDLYRQLFPPNGAVLDLMSSWVSHLPEEVSYSRVVGLGMNEVELKANPRLNSYVVQNLNQQAQLPFPDNEFDAAAICVSIQYLTNPVAVLRETGRVLRAGAPICITFSNRCFPTKAVAVWQALDDKQHTQLVRQYLIETDCWIDIETIDAPRRRVNNDPLYALIGRKIGRSCDKDQRRS